MRLRGAVSDRAEIHLRYHLAGVELEVRFEAALVLRDWAPAEKGAVVACELAQQLTEGLGLLGRQGLAVQLRGKKQSERQTDSD